MRLLLLIVTICSVQSLSAQCPVFFWGIDLCNNNISELRAMAAKRGASDQTSRFTDERLHFSGPFDGQKDVELSFSIITKQGLVRVDTQIASGVARFTFRTAAARDSLMNKYLKEIGASYDPKDYHLVKIPLENPNRLRYYWRKNTWNQPQDFFKAIDIKNEVSAYSIEVGSYLFDYLPKPFERPTNDTTSFREY